MVTRREFLKDAALAVGGAVGTTLTGCLSSTAPVVRAQVQSNRISIETTRPELANTGDGILLTADELDYPILFIRVAPDRFVALSTECMHLGCTVKKQPSVIRCPCHGSVYDLEGRVLNGPAEQPLKQYGVRIHGTMAEIQCS
jgi:Rieske Fe-S protein